MRRMITTALLLTSLFAGQCFAQQFSTLEERMTAAEFKAAGLDKLTPEELAALNDWLAGKVAAATAAAPAQDTRGFNQQTGEDGAIVSSIRGEFKGWKGAGQRFTLDNGQVWEITDSTSRLVVDLVNPVVFVEPGMLGAWFLKVEGYNSRARVKRIK